MVSLSKHNTMHHNGRVYEFEHRLETTDEQPTVHGGTIGEQHGNRTASGAVVMALLPVALVAVASFPAVAVTLALAVGTAVAVTRVAACDWPRERDVETDDSGQTPVVTLPE